MTFALGQRAVRAILLDIEGTTTPVSFVYEVLFPFARQRLRPYLRDPAHLGVVHDVLKRLRGEWEGDGRAKAAVSAWLESDPESAAPYLEWLMDRDVKSPALKLLQGHIWESGYRAGALKGQVFPDVPRAFARWRAAGVAIAIYSSGSVLAQQLLFGATAEGALTPFISAFFDTGVGAKRWPDSYRKIAAQMNRQGAEMLFVSDTPAELDAARSAGYQVLLAARPGNQPVDDAEVDTIRTFDQIV